VAPVKQKPRKTKTAKKRAKVNKAVRLNGSASNLMWNRLALLVRHRERLSILVSTNKYLWEEKSEPEWDLLRPEERIKEGLLTVSERSAAAARERKHVEDDEAVYKQLFETTKQLLIAASPFKAMRFTLRLSQQGICYIHTTAGKYYTLCNTAQINLPFQQLASASEVSSLALLFDECFIHSVEYHFVPRNSRVPYQFATANVQSSMGCVFYLPYNDPAYADGITVIQTAVQRSQSKIIDTGKAFTFIARNETHFDWNGDLMDQSTTSSSMGWCSFNTLGTKYGGNIYLALDILSGAAGAQSVYAQGYPLGSWVAFYNISVRARA